MKPTDEENPAELDFDAWDFEDEFDDDEDEDDDDADQDEAAAN